MRQFDHSHHHDSGTSGKTWSSFLSWSILRRTRYRRKMSFPVYVKVIGYLTGNKISRRGSLQDPAKFIAFEDSGVDSEDYSSLF